LNVQENIAIKIREYLPEINANDISFDDNSSLPYAKDLTKFTESIQTWSHTILEKAKLPTVAHEAKALIAKYGIESNEGCALRMVIELDAVNSSVENHDASTAALASMKLLEAVWHSSIFQITDNINITKSNTNLIDANSGSQSEPPKQNLTPAQQENDKNRKLYQDTINDLKDKYPHCNVNALRLLAATRLNVGKQELDDLDITPE